MQSRPMGGGENVLGYERKVLNLIQILRSLSGGSAALSRRNWRVRVSYGGPF